MSKPVLIIDCNNLCFRALYTSGALSNWNEPTGVAFGFLNQLLSLVEKYQTNRCIFCWDSKIRYRRAVYPTYKMKRSSMVGKDAEKLKQIASAMKQMRKLRKDLLPALGFRNNFMAPGYEADDLMAVVCNLLIEKKKKIVTSDADIYQLIDVNTAIYNPHTKKEFGLKQFVERFKLTPDQWAMAKAIGGCSSDEVKGVKGATDPAKNDNAKSLQYLRGELVKGVVLERINGSQELIKKNLAVVQLPFQGPTPISIKIKKEKFDSFDFLSVFGRMSFNHHLKEEVFNRWRIFFDE